ncbi:FAD/NAD-P-binding domain-containing protein [Mycena floridula]|nr:FAD/NAD-P-binding domain-containing protein [Mycena floridula]
MTDTDLDAKAIAGNWLAKFATALSSDQVDLVTSCFSESDAWFRDTLVFSWDNRTQHGIEKISKYLANNMSETRISDLELVDETGLSPELGPLCPWLSGVSSGFTFSTPIATGKGFFRIHEDAGEWKAFTVFMMLDQLKGSEEMGHEEGVYGGHTIAWSEVQQDRASRIENDPHVLIIGAGQTGLNVAARFKQMNIPTLVVERNPKVGDNWRQRYPTLSLHTIKKHHTLLYQAYPSTWPEYTPRDKLANWLEQYAVSQDLVVWTSSHVLPTPEYDPITRKWQVIVEKEGQKITLRPSHIVIATGGLGAFRLPTNIKNQDVFKGIQLHAGLYAGGQPFSGKHVLVVGAGNTSADICQDLVVQGAESVTMLQRSTTCVVKASTIRAQLEFNFPEKVPLENCDLKFFATPLPLIKEILGYTAEENWKREKDIHDDLRRAGLNLNMGDNGSGSFPMVFENFGGYWLDVGAAKLIGAGKILIKQGVEIAEFTESGVIFTDGSTLATDVIIFATGYQGMRESSEAIFGADAIARTGPVWGLDGEGELRGVFRPTGHPGLWFAAGDFANSRFSSKHLGIQIQAIQLGLLRV